MSEGKRPKPQHAPKAPHENPEFLASTPARPPKWCTPPSRTWIGSARRASVIAAAALGSMVERFAEMLHEFSDRTQFIVITHNMSTIVSAQDWLGVTMQEPGISTLLPVRLPQAQEVLQI